jgi:two-component system NarL family sensor kinase
VRNQRTALAIVIGTVAIIVAAWVIWFADGQTFADAASSYLLTNSAMSLTFTALGAIVLWHRPWHPIALLFLVYGGLLILAIAAGAVLIAGGPSLRAAAFTAAVIWAPAPCGCLPLIIQLFPDGTVLSRRWRFLVPLTVVFAALFTLTFLFSSHAIDGLPIDDHSPLVPAIAPTIDAIQPAVILTTTLVGLMSVVVLILRLVRSHGVQRSQLLWLLWAMAVFIVLNGQRLVTANGPVLFLLTLPLVPAAATIAIVRHQLYDIRLVINRSLVYGLLTVGVVGAYLGIVALLGTLAHDRLGRSPLVATAVIALAFAPARSALQGAVDRVMYGRRRDPAVAAALVGVQLGAGLQDVLQAVRDALRLPYAAIVAGDQLVVESGTPPTVRHAVALEVGAGEPADLVVGLRAGETRVSTADARALNLLAAPVGVALHAVRLTEQLRESRARIVTAREEERRRLRRDLHDGLGTALTAVTLKADAAHNLRHDPDRSGPLLLDLRDDVAAAIADIRRLVYDLRPPDLDELGLVGALRQLAEQSWRPLSVRIEADGLGALPAAVEVAAYRIATEAVTNSLRHGAATECVIRLDADLALRLSIQDNGTGGSPLWRPGVGLRSMQERAAELGGAVSAGPSPDGALVSATLPLAGRIRMGVE